MRQRIGRRRFLGKRRRVSQGTWFPIGGTTFADEDGEFRDASITNTLGNIRTARGGFGSVIGVHPLTADYTQQQSAVANATPIEERPSLRDYTEGQDYILKRLVGNLNVFVNLGINNVPFTPGAQWTHVQVGAGFFVARSSDQDQSLPDLTSDELDPLLSQNIQNSWIWRRTWILDNPQNEFFINGGASTTSFAWDISSNRDLNEITGAHFDTKSKRRIKREERLWVAVSAIGWDGARVQVSGTDADQPVVDYNVDVRLFGKMVKGRASATF